ncbi:MAG: DUF3177 family protein [Pseudanabaena sp.]|jgi:hypothetical protein|nr:DUF3177 family protein [Pseudanabaena sp. M172S2SP2A07QC]MCA6510186.1 DUF3177 family protein [Pseudanabaena sp. M109S1SP2A07QC]MCA6519384.1 DUF3177 family protein [Pseudanabaena sp. M110S1SP2A07QC]MCA6524399.1 DUF3177 family protein [Pseudanabaena sp. M051S1SP2A07QC]MCA6526387.1 DUF3177 family protein [Pseudanabaena sp. M179S2SP2A07QC]MCA6532526.1 DUF3177 family protein [Pseudanabaena sp. M125S2SP2A07QC]MCA6535955.1 DUF3177 family protein [Pseudanabaena sp. M176S2SP2A07QC]MCA6540131.1 DUF
MDATLIRQLVWLDYRLALLFIVLIPFGLLVWALRSGSEAIKRSLLLYWRVASLVLITIYLAIGNLGISYISGIVAAVLIVLSLWFWQDLNEDIGASRQGVKQIYLGWRWATTVYCSLSVVFRLIFANCAFMKAEQLSNICKVWFEPPLSFSATFHNGVPVENLAFVGAVGGIVYMLYFFSFLAFSLPKTGRIAFRD